MLGSPFELVVPSRSGVLLLARNMSISDRSIPGAFGIALWILMAAKMPENSCGSYLSLCQSFLPQSFWGPVPPYARLTFLLLDWDAVEKVGSPFLSPIAAILHERSV